MEAVPAEHVGSREPAVAAGDRSLDQRTQLPDGGDWIVAVVPDAGEATIAVRLRPALDIEITDSLLVSDEQRAALNHERANRRAIKESRQYMVGNRLRYMWVLTYRGEGLRGPDGRAECMRQVARFAARLRALFGPLAYWYSPELHPGGHGWHVNFFVARRIPHARMAAEWGHGNVWVSDWLKDSRVQSAGLPVLDAIRLGASYGCKYASKDWSEQVLAGGAHRYEIAQGFKPRKIIYRVERLATGFRAARWHFAGTEPDQTWRSADDPNWTGPPVYCLSWSTLPGAVGDG